MLADDLDLTPEALDHRRAFAQVRVEDFEGDLRPCLFVARPHDLGDRTAADRSEHPVAARQQLGQAGRRRRDRHGLIFAQAGPVGTSVLATAHNSAAPTPTK